MLVLAPDNYVALQAFSCSSPVLQLSLQQNITLGSDCNLFLNLALLFGSPSIKRIFIVALSKCKNMQSYSMRSCASVPEIPRVTRF